MSTNLLHKHKRLILGSAQFGLDYGISNQQGKVPLDEVKKILLHAKAAGINKLDTATAYGDSEITIGNALKDLQLPMDIITKYPSNQKNSIKKAFNDSLDKLGVEKLYGYMLHSFSDYKASPNVFEELQELKAQGKVEKIGLSIYHPYEAEELLDNQEPVDILQFPYNVLDQRFEMILPKLAELNIETHVRSVYLQGLFFLQPAQLPANLKKVSAKLEALQQLAQEEKLHLGALLLGYVLANTHITKIVIGVESLANLIENIGFADITLTKSTLFKLQNFKELDESIILPYNW